MAHLFNNNLREKLTDKLRRVNFGENPVHEMRDRVQSAFSPSQNEGAIDNKDCVRAINRFLHLIGWAQGERRVFEALPHADSVETMSAFRSVLFRLGFTTTLEPVSPENIRAEYLPCFIRQSDGRIVLAEKIDKDDLVVIYDASEDTHETTPTKNIEGVAIFPEDVENSDFQASPTGATWSQEAILAFRPVISQIFCISFVINLFALAPPLFVMTVYDKAIGSKSFDVLAGLVVGIGLVIAADYALRQIRVKLQGYLGARLDEQLNESAFRHLLHLSLSHTEDAPIGSQLTRLRQMTSLYEAFTGPLANAIFDLPFVLLFVTVIAIIGGHIVWAPVALIVVYAIVAAWALPRTNHLVRKAGDAKAQLNNLVVEAVSSQRAIHDLAAEQVWLRRQRRLSAEASVAGMKARQLSFLIQTFSQSMVAIAGVAILAFGASAVIAGELSAGALIAVMALSWRVLGPIRNLFLSGLTIGQIIQSLQQVNRLTKMPLEREPNKGPSIPRTFRGRVVFDKVTFRYPGQREPSLRSVSFEVKPGELMCLYGQSGSGSSSVLRVLMGLYQQQAGSIFIDGLDLRQLDKGEWRHALGVALQAPDLFFGTVAQNIRLAQPDASEEELARIVRQLGIDKYFGGALQDGVHSKCTAMAQATWPDALVSRIILARAFVRPTPICLLDEPAATLDDDGEKALVSIIEERRKNSAIIMTTQRPSHMRLADKVMWLDRGMVRELGPPDEVVPKIMAAEIPAKKSTTA